MLSPDCFAKFTVDKSITDSTALPHKIVPKPTAPQVQQRSDEDDAKHSELFTY